MSADAGSYKPPRLEEDGVFPADASEDAKAPLLSRDDAAVPQRSTPVVGTIPASYPTSQGPGGLGALPDLPNAAAAWSNQQVLMTVWMLLSCLQFITSVIEPWTLVPAICGLLGSGLFVCACCNLDLPRMVSSCMAMGFVGGGLDMFALLLNILLLFNPMFHCDHPISIEDPDGNKLVRTVSECKWDLAILIILTFMLAGHAWVSFRVAIVAERIRNMLNPVTNGVVNLV